MGNIQLHFQAFATVEFFDHLQFANIEREDLVHMNDVNVRIGSLRGGGHPNGLDTFSCCDCPSTCKSIKHSFSE